MLVSTTSTTFAQLMTILSSTDILSNIPLVVWQTETELLTTHPEAIEASQSITLVLHTSVLVWNGSPPASRENVNNLNLSAMYCAVNMPTCTYRLEAYFPTGHTPTDQSSYHSSHSAFRTHSPPSKRQPAGRVLLAVYRS
jgi:hypothetical protein